MPRTGTPASIDRGRRQRRALVEHGGRPAGEDHALRAQRPEGLIRLLERHDLAIDLLFAHPPGNELGHLRPEIDDQDLVVAGEPVGAGAAHERGIEDGHSDVCAAGGTSGQGAGYRSPQPGLKRPISGRRAASGSWRPGVRASAAAPRPRRADDAKLAGAHGGGDGVWRTRRHFSNGRAETATDAAGQDLSALDHRGRPPGHKSGPHR